MQPVAKQIFEEAFASNRQRRSLKIDNMLIVLGSL